MIKIKEKTLMILIDAYADRHCNECIFCDRCEELYHRYKSWEDCERFIYNLIVKDGGDF